MSTRSQANRYMAPKDMKEFVSLYVTFITGRFVSIPFMQLQSAKKLDYPSLYLLD
jgi:hypothetical protein